ncbi:MAG: hypothetical protein ACRDQZ_20620 [Mycobacteriales bacterium]
MIRKVESDSLTIERLDNDDLRVLDKERESFQLHIEYALVPELLLALEALYPND